MKIVADRYIPNVIELFSPLGEVQLLDPESICSENIQNVDALLVRTATQVNEALLNNTQIKWVGSATAGKNHVDEKYLKRQNIRFCYAPGCNALAVTDYVLSCIASLGENIANKKIGVVGVGHVGKLVCDVLSRAGARVLKNDPPLGMTDNLSDCNIITLHTPLTFDGDFPTHHLINADFLSTLKPGTILINAARGGVLDEDAMRNDLVYCIDVWENEPTIKKETFEKATIATPHIAGYSFAAKYRATHMLYEQFCDWLNAKHPEIISALPPTRIEPSEKATAQHNIALNQNWQKRLLKIYNPKNDRFDPTHFKNARRQYVLRPEVVFS